MSREIDINGSPDRGLVAIVKMDGERQRARWTVLVSGKPLGEELVRWDGNDRAAGWRG